MGHIPKAVIRVVKSHWPLMVAIGLFWAALVIALGQTAQQTDGRLVYALDDPYIHMAVARNFAEHGVWGVTRYEFSSSTSSSLWPLLLALEYALLRPNEISAFVWNALFASLTLVIAYRFLRRSKLTHPVAMLAVLAALTFSTPFPVITFIGMEHALHAFVALAFCLVCAREIAQPQRHGLLWMSVWSFLACLTRYESAFIVLAVCLLLFLRRRWVDGIVVGGMGLLPIIGYGLISTAHGWYFLPNSLYLRGPEVEAGMKVLQVIKTAVTSADLSALVLAAAVMVATRIRRSASFAGRWPSIEWSAPTVAMMIFVMAASIHLAAARSGWFYRYEAYLVALGITVVAAGLAERPPRVLKPGYVRAVGFSLVGLVSAVGVVALATRGVNSYREIPGAVSNIYQQQYQMGLFLREFYPEAGVVANDIGAINYLADIHNLDSYGLGSLAVLEAKREGRYDSAELGRLAAVAHSQIAIVYDEWLPPGGAPSGWTLVGQWTIENLSVVADDTISFYAIDPDEQARLARHLQTFAAQLPATVMQEGAYVAAAG
jgi:hypothetical protein